MQVFFYLESLWNPNLLDLRSGSSLVSIFSTSPRLSTFSCLICLRKPTRGFLMAGASGPDSEEGPGKLSTGGKSGFGKLLRTLEAPDLRGCSMISGSVFLSKFYFD
jgi:hypothetical protein